MTWYNGFSPKVRERKGAAAKRLQRAGGVLEGSQGPCMLCGDPSASVEPHSEDYSEPYGWTPPRVYWLCGHCHRNKLHKRFHEPELWSAFLDHVRRGGYASELRKGPENVAVRKEFRQYRNVLARGEKPTLPPRNGGHRYSQPQWFDGLSMNPICAEEGCPPYPDMPR